MRCKGIVASGMTAAVLACGPAQSALAEGFHFGVFGGMASPDISKADYDELFAVTESTLDDNVPSWGIQVGYSWNSYVAVEVGYVDLGKAMYETDLDPGFVGGDASIRFLASGPTLAVLGMLPVGDKFNVFGRAGILFSDTRIRLKIDDDSAEIKASDKDVLLGVGGAWNINDSYALRLEYQRFLDVGDEDHTGESDVDLIAVSFLFK